MDFLNEQIDSSSIPDAKLVNWQPIEKDYLKVLRLEWLIATFVLLFIVIAFLFFMPSLQKPIPIILLIAAWLSIVFLYYFIQEKSFRQLAYAIRGHDILYRHGWIVRRVIACPISRIQHCSADAGPLDRKYKLSSLTLFTAGASGADVKIPGLRAEVAQNLREFIMSKIKTDEQTGN